MMPPDSNSLFTRSGNFDFPQASETPSAVGALSERLGSLTGRFEGLRQTLQNEREESEHITARRRDQANPTPPTMPRPRRRTRPVGISQSNRPRSPTSFSPNPWTLQREPPRVNGEIVRQIAAGNRAHLRRLREAMREENHELAEELRDRRQHLDRISNHLNETESRLRNYDSSSTSRRRMNKRRKLDHDGDVGMLEPYGYMGQVVPGQLKMEIMSCDGGEYQDPRSMDLENYRAENILREDTTVYCTKSSRCNLMLRQRGETLFHLESLIIAAPKRGFTAPVQEGLVFVGMSADKLTAATTSYAIQYTETEPRSRLSSPEESTRPSSSSREHLSLIEAVSDDQVWQTWQGRNSNIQPPYTLPPPRTTASRPHSPRHFPATSDTRSLFEEGSNAPQTGENAYLDNCDWSLLASSSNLTRAPTPPPFTVSATMDTSTSSISDAESTIYGSTHPAWSSAWYRGPLESDTEDNEDATSSIARRVFMLNSLRDRHPHGPLPARRDSPGIIDTSREASTEAAGGGGVEQRVEPNARFFMPKNDCRITIRFHPPVAGRFILLKLFSPQLRDGENIDIEYVAAHGFSGPRFFPSVEMR